MTKIKRKPKIRHPRFALTNSLQGETAETHTYFKILAGPHVDNDCAGCHTSPDDFSVSCIDCHDHNEEDTLIEHVDPALELDVEDYLYETPACMLCHPGGRGFATREEHGEAYPIDVDTAHEEFECIDCHREPEVEKVACYECHLLEEKDATTICTSSCPKCWASPSTRAPVNA
ncbi:MAG: hypothetical protein GY822_29625 [Deltaproteobacteria bacterium]|nr:hypothetical protein [Deltaproteobacteria bacterium]